MVGVKPSKGHLAKLNHSSQPLNRGFFFAKNTPSATLIGARGITFHKQSKINKMTIRDIKASRTSGARTNPIVFNVPMFDRSEKEQEEFNVLERAVIMGKAILVRRQIFPISSFSYYLYRLTDPSYIKLDA